MPKVLNPKSAGKFYLFIKQEIILKDSLLLKNLIASEIFKKKLFSFNLNEDFVAVYKLYSRSPCPVL